MTPCGSDVDEDDDDMDDEGADGRDARAALRAERVTEAQSTMPLARVLHEEYGFGRDTARRVSAGTLSLDAALGQNLSRRVSLCGCV